MKRWLVAALAASGMSQAVTAHEPQAWIVSARAKGDLAALVTQTDYPAAALTAREEGMVEFRLEVGPNGRVTGCAITRSSGSTSLDSATCRIMHSRARFTPAMDSNGQRTADSVAGKLAWKLPPA
jgi:protein TonB